uniref:Uncharacterized protein n=1 Tax=Panagrolaimus sp. JU765 TaxID=591449 RepID=A0AC34QRC0_9BILA
MVDIKMFPKIEFAHEKNAPESKPIEILHGFRGTLMKHQQHGIDWMLAREAANPRGGIVADEMGMGQITSFIALIMAQKNACENFKEIREAKAILMLDTFKDKPGDFILAFSTLVVAPRSVVAKWQREIQRCVEPNKLKTYFFYKKKKEGNPRVLAGNDVVFTTYRCFETEMEKGNSPLMKIGWERVILDDAHHIKNGQSHLFKDCRGIPAMVRWASTGLPIQNKLKDLLSLLMFLQVDLEGKKGMWKRFVDSKGEKTTAEIDNIMQTLILRRKKEQIYPQTLPNEKKEAEIVPVELETFEKLCYQHVLKNSKNPSTKLLRLQEICGHLSLAKNAINLNVLKNDDNALDELEKKLGKISINDDNVMEANGEAVKAEDAFPKTFVSSKLKILEEKLGAACRANEKCVVVSEWVRMLEVVKIHLDRRGIAYTAITGDVHFKQRVKRYESFNRKGGPQVLLLSLTTDGNGFKLDAAKHVFFLDLHWNPAFEQQILARIDRQDVAIHKLVAKGTVDENILAMQAKKTSMAEKVLKKTLMGSILTK